ncbi:Slc39a11 [Phodopus roborovskii]|uniref:Zinc transporter ZIP11 n=1 Tax=Phodopus roborovskii TaxID=109678 RepID=A0AAU9YM03_PHORO|nr:Slc39a11 [Phodopus roborovskii]
MVGDHHNTRNCIRKVENHYPWLISFGGKSLALVSAKGQESWAVARAGQVGFQGSELCRPWSHWSSTCPTKGPVLSREVVLDCLSVALRLVPSSPVASLLSLSLVPDLGIQHSPSLLQSQKARDSLSEHHPSPEKCSKENETHPSLHYRKRKLRWTDHLSVLRTFLALLGCRQGAKKGTASSASQSEGNKKNLAIGIGIQNFPEGLAVSLPLRGAGFSTWRAFWYGQLSGMVEPLAGVFGAFAVVLAEPVLPYALAFAAGAMVYVVMDDIIPEAQISGNGKLASWASILGFVVMMSLDVGLG